MPGHTAAVSETLDVVSRVELDSEHAVLSLLSGIKDVDGKEPKRDWLKGKMDNVDSIQTVRALHMYYRIASQEGLIGGPYKDVPEGERARAVVEWGLHKYDGEDWKDYMNEEDATKKPDENEVGVGSSASLITQVMPPDPNFVILILAWLPVGKYPWAGPGGVGAAHTHGQATCNFKFLNAVEGAGNTFYDIAGGNSTQTDIFTDGLPHKGGCKDHEYRPLLLNPRTGREFIPSKDLVGATSGYIQDDGGAHSIDNMNDPEIVFSIHMYYPPYPQAWAFHENKKQHGQQCKPRSNVTHGHANCHEPYERFCTTTSMKKYLEKAADWKKNHGDEHPVKWYHTFCKHVKNEALHKRCTKMYGEWVKHVEDIVTDPTLQA